MQRVTSSANQRVSVLGSVEFTEHREPPIRIAHRIITGTRRVLGTSARGQVYHLKAIRL